jgi:hypothetical protein
MTINAGNPTVNNSSVLAGKIAGVLVDESEFPYF